MASSRQSVDVEWWAHHTPRQLGFSLSCGWASDTGCCNVSMRLTNNTQPRALQRVQESGYGDSYFL